MDIVATPWKSPIDYPNFEMRLTYSGTEFRSRLRPSQPTPQMLIADGKEHSVQVSKPGGGTRKNLTLELLTEQVFRPKEQWAFYEQIEELKLEHPEFATQINDAYTLSPFQRSKLLVVATPELVYSWSSENKKSLGLVYAQEGFRHLWDCLDDEDHSVYFQTPNNKVGSGHGCPACFSERQRNSGTACIDRSRAAELEVLSDFQASNIPTEDTAGSSSIFDLIPMFEDKIPRGIQVKDIGDPRGTLQYCRMACTRGDGSNYPPGTLIVGINVKIKLFFLSFAENLANGQSPNISFSASQSRYSKRSQFLYFNRIDYVKDLLAMAVRAIDTRTIAKHRSDCYQKEYDMKQYLRNLIPFFDPETTYGDIDCSLMHDKVPCQLKCTESMEGNTFTCGGIHELDRTGVYLPYDARTIRFKVLIVQLHNHPSTLYMLPVSVLEKDGVLCSERYKGKHAIVLPGPDNDDHPYSIYRNRIDLISHEPYIPPNDIYDDMVELCIQNGQNAFADRSNVCSIKLIVNSRLVKPATGSGIDFHISCDGSAYCITDENLPHAFLLISANGDYWVVPSRFFVDQGYIGKVRGEGRTAARMIDIFDQFKGEYKWLYRHYNNLRINGRV